MSNKVTNLEQLKGKTFKLGQFDPSNNREFKATDVKYTTTNSVLFTDKRTFNFLKSEIKNFLNLIEIIEAKEPFKANLNDNENLPSTNNQKIDLSVFEPTETQLKTQKALTDMLDKVLAGDKDAIPQAKAVCDIANTMVNMEKSQIQLMQLAIKSNKK